MPVRQRERERERESSLIRHFLATFLSLILLLSSFTPYISASTSLNPYKTKRPIPPSPAPIDQPVKDKKPKELPNKRTKYSKKYAYQDGLFITKSYPKAIHKKGEKGGWEDINPNEEVNQLFLMVDPIPLSLCLYGAGSSFDENGTKSNNKLSLYHYTVIVLLIGAVPISGFLIYEI